MPQIHDWTRVYWRNRDGSRTYPDEPDEDTPDELLSLHENERGETVGYRHPIVNEDEEEPEHKYEVIFNGEVVEDVTLDGQFHDEEEFEELTFDTRSAAREAANDLMRSIPPIKEEMLEDDEEGYSYDELQDLARPRGIKANQSADDLREALAGV